MLPRPWSAARGTMNWIVSPGFGCQSGTITSEAVACGKDALQPIVTNATYTDRLRLPSCQARGVRSSWSKPTYPSTFSLCRGRQRSGLESCFSPWADAAATGRENTAHTSTAMASQASHCSLQDSHLRCAHRVADVFGRSSSDPATLMADVVVLSSTKESRCIERAKTAYVKHKENVMGRRTQRRTRGTCVFYRPLLTGHDDLKLLATRWL